MLKSLAIVLLLVGTSLAAGQGEAERDLAQEAQREKERHNALAAEPTPSEWHSGAIWRFVITDPSGARDVLAFRVTREVYYHVHRRDFLERRLV